MVPRVNNDDVIQGCLPLFIRILSFFNRGFYGMLVQCEAALAVEKGEIRRSMCSVEVSSQGCRRGGTG